MKRALAERAKQMGHSNGLSSPPTVNSPSQPPLKIPKIEHESSQTPASSFQQKQGVSVPVSASAPPAAVPTSSGTVTETETSGLQSNANSNSNNNSIPTSPRPSTMLSPTPKGRGTGLGTGKRQRNSQTSVEEEEESEKSTFFLKHQNAALASELHQLQYQFKLIETERDFRRNQCKEAGKALHSLEATWNAMEVALQLGQQPPNQDQEEGLSEGTTALSVDAPRSTGTGESVELIGALLDSLAALAKDTASPHTHNDNPEDKQLMEIQKISDAIFQRATALQRWIWSLLKKVTHGDESGKHPIFKMAKTEAKMASLKAQVRENESQIAELAKSRDDALNSERKVRRGLYRLKAGRMKLDEVMDSIEDDEKDGVASLLELEEQAMPPVAADAPSTTADGEELMDNAQVLQLRKQLRDLEEISASRDKQIDQLTKEREEHLKRINDLAMPAEPVSSSDTQTLSEDQIKKSDLFTQTWTKMTTAERQLEELRGKMATTREGWASARGDTEHAAKNLEDHLMKHKRRWAELVDLPETENGDIADDIPIKAEVIRQAEIICELEHKLKQALENIRQADAVRLSLEEALQMNASLQLRVDDFKAKYALLLNHSKKPNASAQVSDTKQSDSSEKDATQEKVRTPVKAEATPDEKAEKILKMRKDLAAAMASKQNAKVKLEKSEKEREAVLRTNSRLLKQSTEKDEMNAKSLSTILHLKSLTEKLSQEKELLEQQAKSAGQVNVASRLAANARERVSEEACKERRELEEKIAALEKQCDELKVEKEEATGLLEQKNAGMTNLEKDAATAKERCDELVAESTKQQEEKRKALESLAVAQRESSEAAKVMTKMRSSSNGGGGSDFTTEQLTTQISVLKSRLACPVCNHRDKKCILLRCRHMFCKPCVDENVRNRSRKCPACGQRFDNKDIGDIWL